MSYDPDPNRPIAPRTSDRIVWIGGIALAVLIGLALYGYFNDNLTTANTNVPGLGTTGTGVETLPANSTRPAAISPPSPTSAPTQPSSR